MEGYEINTMEEAILKTSGYDLELEKALYEKAMKFIKNHPVYRVAMSRGSMLLYCEDDVKATYSAFRRVFFSNNRLKRHHIPMRRGKGCIMKSIHRMNIQVFSPVKDR